MRHKRTLSSVGLFWPQRAKANGLHFAARTDNQLVIKYPVLAVNPLQLTTTISRPRAEVFNYLVDIANHAEFSGHYLTDWHLTRIDSVGEGAGARFHINAPLNRFSWGDITFVEVKRPFRIVAIGRTGKFNRIKTYAAWTLSDGPGGGTRIDYEAETEPLLPTDRLIDGLGARRAKREAKRALKQLKLILEGDVKGSGRVTVAGL